MQNFVGKTKCIVGYMKVADRCIFLRVVQYFDEPVGRVKIQTTSRPGGMRRVQIYVICTRFARYLYSRKQSWIIIPIILQYAPYVDP